MKNKKIFISIIVLILIIVVVSFGICFVQYKTKISIIRDLSQKQEKSLKKDNYYQKITKNTDNTKIIIEHYQKGENYITFTDISINDTKERAREIMRCINGETEIYRETGKESLLEENAIAFTMIPVNLRFASSNDKEIINLIKELDITIKSTKLNNKECYVYKMKDIPETYFDKETGLVLKYSNAEFEFEFDNVDDNIFEPDLSGYTLIK